MKLIAIIWTFAIAASASAAPVACPQISPGAWAIGRKPLESVRVMSYPVGETLGRDREYYATPPWDEKEHAGFIEQTWHVNETPEFKYGVDCVYAGTDRFVQLNTAGSRTCVARWRARSDNGVVPRSLKFSCR